MDAPRDRAGEAAAGRLATGHPPASVSDDPLMYTALAGWFHLLTPPADYEQEAAVTLGLLDEHVRGTLRTALELGSGGGNLASHLGDRLELTLSDVSPAMLAVSRSINPRAEHVVGDMRGLRLGRTFDAVIVHDAVTYLTSEADVSAMLRTAWVHLRPGGAVILMPDWVRDTFRPATEHGGSDDGQRGLRYLEWDGDVRPDGHSVRTDFVIITREGDDVRVFHDVHTLGLFSRATWLRLMVEAGFVAHRRAGVEGLDVFLGVRPLE